MNLHVVLPFILLSLCDKTMKHGVFVRKYTMNWKCIYVCMYVCMYVSMCICISAYMCVDTYEYAVVSPFILLSFCDKTMKHGVSVRTYTMNRVVCVYTHVYTHT